MTRAAFLIGLFTMALTTLYTDDFSGYANQAAFEAAYPTDPPSNMATSVVTTTWGMTEGPGSTPGVNANVGSAGFFHKRGLNPCGRLFRVVGTFDWSGNSEHPITIYWHQAGTGTPGTRSDNIVDVWRSSAEINVSVRTVSSGQFNPNRYHEWASDSNPAHVVTAGVANVVRVDGLISTLTETSPGVFAPNADGYVRVYFDDVLWFEYANQEIWNGNAAQDITPRPYWNAVQIQPTGRFSDLEIHHDDSCDGINVIDNADVCCSTSSNPDVPAGGGQGNGAAPIAYPSIGAQIECAGGGLVPEQASLVHSEAWWGA